MKKHLKSLVGAASLATLVFMQTIATPLAGVVTAYADTINADGSITKTATQIYTNCSGGWEEDCDGGSTSECNGPFSASCPGGSRSQCPGGTSCSGGTATTKDCSGGTTSSWECSGGTKEYCSGSGSYAGGGCEHGAHAYHEYTVPCSHGKTSAHTVSSTTKCSHGKTSAHTYTETTKCSHGYTGSHIVLCSHGKAASHYYNENPCSHGNFSQHSYSITCSHGKSSSHSVDNPCSHGKMWSHTVEHTCSHGYVDSHEVFKRYENIEYGYSTTSRSGSTFKVYPITIQTQGQLQHVITVDGANATDAAISGKSVKIDISGAPDDTEIKITNTGTGTTQIITIADSPYVFRMPAKVTDVTIEYLDSIRATDLVYGQSLSESIISDLNPPCAGHWEWDTPDRIPNVSDSNTTDFGITFIPDDPTVTPTARTKKVIVTKYIAPITGADVAASDIDYGQSLADVVFTGTLPKLNGVDIPGTFTWVNPSEVPNAGIHDFEMKFTPDDTSNIESITFVVSVTINQAPITLTDEMIASIAASDITYEQSLADSTLTGFGPVLGHYEWKDPTIKPKVRDSGVTPYEVSFVPDDTNYASADANCTLVITKRAFVFTPESISQIIASDIAYGQSLADSSIDGFKPCPGSYSWADSSIYPNVNDPNNFSVIFTPDDLENYDIVTVGDIHVSVSKARPDISIDQIAAIEVTPIDYGQSLRDSTIIAESRTPGHFEWEDPTITPSVADSGNTGYNIKFIPDDAENFDTILIPITMIVNKINPPVPADLASNISSTGIQFGQTLGDSSLSYTGSGTLNGSLIWDDNTITPAMADSDIAEYDVWFVYVDDVNYNRLPYKSKVHVDKTPAPTGIADATKTENVFLGASKDVKMRDFIPLVGIRIEALTYSDPDGIFSQEPTAVDDQVHFGVKSGRELVDKSATIDLELSCRDYLNFDATITVVTSYCEHRHLSYGVGKQRATCYSEGYTGNTVCDDCGLTIKWGVTRKIRDHWEIARGEIPATCTSEGFSGDIYCFICDEFLEHGHKTDFAPHTEGEPEVIIQPAADREGLVVYHCTVCGEFLRREEVPKLSADETEHSWSEKYVFSESGHWRICDTCLCEEELHQHTFDSGVLVSVADEQLSLMASNADGMLVTVDIADTTGGTTDTEEGMLSEKITINSEVAERPVKRKICYTCTVCGYSYEVDAPDQSGDTPSDNPYTGIDLAAIRIMSLLGAAGMALLLSKRCKISD